MAYRGHRLGCTHDDHPHIGRRRLLEAGGMSLFGLGLADLLASRNKPPRRPLRRGRPRNRWSSFFNPAAPRSMRRGIREPNAPAEIRGEYGTTATRIGGYRICEICPSWLSERIGYSIVRTMHHPAPPQFRNEHSASMYMVQTGRCELPPGETTNSIALPMPRRFEWPSLGSAIADALANGARSGLPPVVELPRANGRMPGDGPGMLGGKYTRWRMDLASPCRTPDGGGSCPNCFAHDQPNNPARAPGKQMGAWWDNSSCRQPDFHLPDLGLSTGLSVENLQSRAELLADLDKFRRGLDSEPTMRNMEVYWRQAWDLILGQKGKDNPFDLTQESDATRDLYGREESGRRSSWPAGWSKPEWHGASQSAWMGYAPKRVSRSEGPPAAIDRSLPERFPG